MIEVSQLSKLYGDRKAIDQLTFHVNKGEIVGFLGPNGAGKTTTMKIITGFMAPSQGSVRIAGFDVFEHPIEVKQKIGYLPETPPVYGDMRVDDYLTFVAKLKNVESDKIKNNVGEAIEKTNLEDVSRRMIQNLSKGYRQRVGLAQALVSKPEILILDEPTVGLDPRQMSEIRKLMQSLRGHHTIVLSTHILPEVQAMCERAIIINNGKIVAEDSLVGLGKRMSGGQRVVLKVRRAGGDLEKSLRSVRGVLSVTPVNGTYEVSTEENEDAIEAIASHVVQTGAGLMELRTLTMNLEDVFIKLTTDTH